LSDSLAEGILDDYSLEFFRSIHRRKEWLKLNLN